MSVNPPVIATDKGKRLRRGMTPLPRALLIPALGLPGLAGSRGDIALVDAASPLHALRKLLAGGTRTVALSACRTGADLQRMATLLAVAEAEENRPEGCTAILALTDGILPAPAAPQSLAGKSTRLAGLVWDQRALAHRLGAARPFTENGEWASAFAAARAATLFMAAVAGVPVYDSALATEESDFARSCKRSRDEGFFGRVAADTAQILLIEAIYASA